MSRSKVTLLFHFVLVVCGDAFVTSGRRLNWGKSSLSVALAEEDIQTMSSIPSWEDLHDLLERHPQFASWRDESKKPLVTLYRDTNGWCPFCERVWLALEIKGIPYQEQLINLQDKPMWFLQMVPTGLVPAVLFHSDQIEETDTVSPERSLVWESLDIMTALDARFPDTPRLVRDDDPEYAVARQVAGNVTAAGMQFVYGARNETVTEQDKAQKKLAFRRSLSELDAFLGRKPEEGPFCLGSSMSGVDIEIVPTMERWRYQLPITSNISIYDESEFPNIVRWFRAMDQHPAYYQRVSGDAYSWTVAAGTFLRYFANGPNGTISEQTQITIARADAMAQNMTDSFSTCTVYEEASAAKFQAAAKIMSNYDAIVADCTRFDPKSQKDLPRSSDRAAADAMLRAVVHQLLAVNNEALPVDGSVDAEQAAVVAETVAARLCVPRDMGAPAAQVLRKTLTQAAKALRGTRLD